VSRPLLLDLFCGAGGAAVGYHRAGFRVVGVDRAAQPFYPFEFIQTDALDVLEDARRMGAAVVHASPPCQSFTAYRRRETHGGQGYLPGMGVGALAPNLVPQTRDGLIASRLPYVIENVEGAPLDDPITLCGSMFGLDVRRHRLFESNVELQAPACNHLVWTERKWPQATNRTNRRFTCEVGAYRIPLDDQKRAMGVDWETTLDGLSQMIPPAYTEHIGRQLMDHIARQAA
jgi:DNA (cytosine-5)-methyltransferase 1